MAIGAGSLVECARPWVRRPDGDRFASLLAVSAIAWWGLAVMHDVPGQGRSDAADRGAVTAAEAPETVFGAYGGIPYTHASDIRFQNPPGTDLSVHGVNWDGRPFKAPIYYGLRTVRWGSGAFGGMVDFLHSKAISQRKQKVQLSGTRNGERIPASTSTAIEEAFKHLEFSHGHNLLTLNGMARLGRLTPWLRPYLGAGAGVALPHTEIQFTDEAHRTYEYQYAGPAGQVMLGFEICLPRTSIFIEYKFTLAQYVAPLTGNDSRGWGISDLPAQLMRWVRGEKAKHGTASTTLASHQIVGGIGVRIAAPGVQ